MADGITRFDYAQGSWLRVAGTDLATFVRWVLADFLTVHGVLRRYRHSGDGG